MHRIASALQNITIRLRLLWRESSRGQCFEFCSDPRWSPPSNSTVKPAPPKDLLISSQLPFTTISPVLELPLGLNFSTIYCKESQFLWEESRSCFMAHFSPQAKPLSHRYKAESMDNCRLLSDTPSSEAEHLVGMGDGTAVSSLSDLPLDVQNRYLTCQSPGKGSGVPSILSSTMPT